MYMLCVFKLNHYSFLFFFLTYLQGVLKGPAYTLDEMDHLRIVHDVVVIGYGETYEGQKV